MVSLSPTDIRELVLNVQSPIVLKNLKIPWKCFDLSLQDWCSLLENHMNKKHCKINFEVGRRKHTHFPQWERFRDEKELHISEFLEENSDFLSENWACLSYRNIEELPDILRDDIKFTCFGFPEIDDNDTTFWLNTKDCNTSCHYDTYGCNVVVQVFGRKSWLLFPPTSVFDPIRIPYEESSVYCSTNFYSPNDLRQFKEIKDKCHRCVLEPGDILIVPKNWWHYVESLETSLSFNHWIPLESDIESQLDECLVKYIIEKFLVAEDETNIRNFLNPNQLISFLEDAEILQILEKLCDENLHNNEENEIASIKKPKTLRYPYMYLTEAETENIIKNLKCDHYYVKTVLNHEFLELMRNNSLRYDKTLEEKIDKSSEAKLKEILINSICHPNMISNIRKLLLENYKKDNK
ncbi:HSPB1-associated protein 1 [Condylostylus longicornis]|uniref:HSPB1-associated protein 1 n=1 Tax=Condylostylus longicornis TaxID=2530218 RepID=UPI00244DAD6C|nr:HSPB1-associated protein 1 [Condylostylus longicornis]